MTDNTLSGTPGISLQGGGLFTAFSAVLIESIITKNTPDDCFGC